MTISRRDALFTSAAALPMVGLLAAAARAQAPISSSGGTVITPEDPLLAACLFGLGKRQIEVSTAQKSMSQYQEIQAFCQAEIDEQQMIKADLEKLGFTPPNPAARPVGGSATNPVVPVVAIGKVVIPAPGSQQIEIASEVVEQCINNTKMRLGKLTGLLLEKAIVGDQLHEHYILQDHALVFGKHASPAMMPTLNKGLAIINAHIAKLETMALKLEAMTKNEGSK